MKKIILNFIAFFIFIVSPNIMAETMNVSGLYIGERWNNVNKVEDFLDKLNVRGPSFAEQLLPFLKRKNLYGYYVSQNSTGLNILILEKKLWFTGMKLNKDGSFSGESKKHSLEGFFDKDIFQATFVWKDASTFYLVGELSATDKQRKKELEDLRGGPGTIENLKKQIANLQGEIEKLKKAHALKIKEMTVNHSTEMTQTTTRYENKIQGIESERDTKITKLNEQLSVQPKINHHNVSLSDTVNTDVTLRSGPIVKEDNKLLIINEGSRISKLREVRNDSSWSLIATDQGRIGYIKTAYIVTSKKGTKKPVNIPTGPNDINISQPGGIEKEGDKINVDAKGPKTIKGSLTIKNVKTVLVNDMKAKYKDNIFSKSVNLVSGENQIVIHVETNTGKKYNFKFILIAP